MFSKRSLRTTAIAIIVSIPAAIGLLALPTYVLISGSQVAAEVVGTAIETSRDINGEAKAPVSYDYNNAEFTEFIYGEYAAGDSVSLSVTAEGTYLPLVTASQLAVYTFILGLMGVSCTVLLWILISTLKLAEGLKDKIEATSTYTTW